ncbi:hypothetical protein [Nocardiopsis sp. NRRL B-16309]|uniref:hypothetical protein n=1 Tax=Nocardiopsis sp. NRRL B-16309 TaxID=1519494 RepID=UPI0006AED968|nr:hypothetical protein [Nocardiopsis sp. NRRL B-16309]
MVSKSGMLDRLVARGVAARTSDPDDHRVHATPRGASVVWRMVVARPFRGDLHMGLRMEDLHAFEQGFRAVSEQMAAMGERA